MWLRRRITTYLIVLLALAYPVGAAAAGQGSDPAATGIVFVVEGIGGLDFVAHAAQASLVHAGLPDEIRIFAWTHGTGHFLKDLQDTKHVLLKADELAAEVLRVKESDPAGPYTWSARAEALVWSLRRPNVCPFAL